MFPGADRTPRKMSIDTLFEDDDRLLVPHIPFDDDGFEWNWVRLVGDVIFPFTAVDEIHI